MIAQAAIEYPFDTSRAHVNQAVVAAMEHYKNAVRRLEGRYSINEVFGRPLVFSDPAQLSILGEWRRALGAAIAEATDILMGTLRTWAVEYTTRKKAVVRAYNSEQAMQQVQDDVSNVDEVECAELTTGHTDRPEGIVYDDM